jgi:hypothetical protein
LLTYYIYIAVKIVINMIWVIVKSTNIGTSQIIFMEKSLGGVSHNIKNNNKVITVCKYCSFTHKTRSHGNDLSNNRKAVFSVGQS